MPKTPEFKLIDEAERRQLIRELKEMWRTIPKHVRARARQLGEVHRERNSSFAWP